MIDPRRQDGFTLIELLVSMALAMIVFGATLTALDVFQTNTRADVLRNETQDNARSAIDRLAKELRNVAAPKSEPELPGALEQAEPYSIVFQTVDSTAPPPGSKNASNAMRVRYCLNNTTPGNEALWRQVKRWPEKAPPLPSAATCPDLTGEDWDSSSRLVEHLTNRDGGQNRQLFIYGPIGWSETARIVTVAPNLFIDLNPGHPRPGETQLTSSISLRNANRQPLATFTATEKSGGLVFLNASESVDPDGLALSYKWSEGASEGEKPLPSTAQQWETGKLTSGTTHTFWLKVTDPGGLNSSAPSQTVTIK
jgi:prepilin-type N-terminal cleavage/methylation domain-containing protein